MKKVITESQLKRIIKESAKRVIMEISSATGGGIKELRSGFILKNVGNGKKIILDPRGKPINDYLYDSVHDFDKNYYGGLAMVYIHDVGANFVRKNGTHISDIWFKDAYMFNGEGTTDVQLGNGDWTSITRDGVLAKEVGDDDFYNYDGKGYFGKPVGDKGKKLGEEDYCDEEETYPENENPEDENLDFPEDYEPEVKMPKKLEKDSVFDDFENDGFEEDDFENPEFYEEDVFDIY